MYLIAFIVKKAARPVITAFVWSMVLVVPILLAKMDFFDLLVIQGRCRSPLNTCGQDNLVLAYAASALIPAATAGIVTWLLHHWNDREWIEQRKHLRAMYAPRSLSQEPPAKPEISTLGEGI